MNSKNQGTLSSRMSEHSFSSHGIGRNTPAPSRRHISQASQRVYTQTQNTSFQTPINETYSCTSSDQYQATKLWGTNIDVSKIEEKFNDFLLNFKASVPNMRIQESQKMSIESQAGEVRIYFEKLNQMKESEQFILTIDGEHIFQYDKELYNQLIYFPAEIIQIFDRALSDVYCKQFLESQDDRALISSRLLIGIVNLRTTKILRSLNPNDLNHLISIKGIVIRCSQIYPEMKAATFKCTICGYQVQSVLERGRVEEPQDCQQCKSKNSFEIQHSLCQFTDKQYIKLQETPESVPEGDIPQSTTLVAYDDNVDSVKPGDRVDCVGVFRAQGIRTSQNRRQIKSVYNTYIDVISYSKLDKNRFMFMESEKIIFTPEVQNKIFDIAQNDNVYDRLVKSLAPSIWENDDIKKGILCQLFGGTPKNFSQAGKGRFRAEINCILVGDPSVAKSQFLQYVHKIAPRGIYTSGKGSSAVGLTAYVSRDPETKELVLESGALVLSDLGICCIDEFDKMDDNTRAILHEAMEQQTISVAKAGIVAQLNARTAILAAANPVQSKYDAKKSVIQNINLPPTLLSRFDLIYIMLDQPQQQRDTKLSSHILSLYTIPQTKNQLNQINQQNIQNEDEDIIDKETLAQYISFARQEIKPKLTQEISDYLVKGYVDMRKLGISKNVITSTPRLLESAIRLSEALAKMRLSNNVEIQDVEEAFRLIRVATQQAATDPVTGFIDMDMITTGITASSRQNIIKISEFINDLIKANQDTFKDTGMYKSQLREELIKKFYEDPEQLVDKDLTEALKVLEDQNIIIQFGFKNTLIKSTNNINIQ